MLRTKPCFFPFPFGVAGAVRFTTLVKICTHVSKDRLAPEQRPSIRVLLVPSPTTPLIWSSPQSGL